MPSGMGAWCSSPSSASWNDAIIERIGRPSWYACVRRVENERPSWMRSTEKVMGLVTSPGRRKYPCMLCGRRSASVVRIAATSDWASTCPPKTRPMGIHCEGPVEMSSLVRAPVSVRSRAVSRPASGPSSGMSDAWSVMVPPPGGPASGDRAPGGSPGRIQ
ncbi:hypothetical protein CMsap09_07620 [Clavibacter michiganensis]|uniref:Uncharacterized protein n=1 Tax=Clavibacter michiganensis TaxID=28447 RepID=A0A251XUH2_9MICO|nr:hypothetical protein CMsap09_07620 [Clavibacter michiganensis]